MWPVTRMLAAFAIAAILPGCGGQGRPSPVATADTATTADPSPAPAPTPRARRATLTTTPLTSPAGASSQLSRAVRGDDGQLYLSWVEKRSDGAHTLRFASLEEAGWSAARTIATGHNWFVNWADFPSLAVSQDGRLAAHWLERNGESD